MTKKNIYRLLSVSIILFLVFVVHDRIFNYEPSIVYYMWLMIAIALYGALGFIIIKARKANEAARKNQVSMS